MIDYFAQHLWQAWLLISFLCLILELTNGDFFILCFAIGALGGVVTSLFTDSITAQIVVFAVVSILCVIFVRPVALRYFHKGEDSRKSNAEALIGRIGVVTDAIAANGYGRVRIDGDSWKAQSADHQEMKVGAKVRVIKLDSIIITVEPASDN